jgi:D-glycero-alpha-D-manno-heptose 1-phosphate guanylyltransferase
MNSDVVILAGGLGTRLKHLLNDVPKPMAPVNKEPFLSYLFQYLKKHQAQRVFLSVGHLHQSIKNYFGDRYLGIDILYIIEDQPLGTGGAINKALQAAQTENVFILNGDSYFDVDLIQMEQQHLKSGHEISIAIKKMYNFERYGSVRLKDSRIIAFEEKKAMNKGYINAGTYLIKRKKFTDIVWPTQFSFEKEFLEKYTSTFYFTPFYSDGYFIDIGIPEDFHKVQLDFKSIFPR